MLNLTTRGSGHTTEMARTDLGSIATATEAEGTPKLDFRKRIPALDGLRGIAILGVFFYHYARGAGNHTDSTAVRAIATIFGFGWTGVDLFFVLSGFLITGILYDTLEDSGYFKTFYVRRALRIFPLYYLLIVVFLLLTPVLGIHWRPAHLFFLFYLGYPAALLWPSLVQVSSKVAITHLWSLSVEEQFYLVWPWVIARLRNPATILRACALVAISALLLRTAICATGPLNVTWAYTFLLCRMDTIATGAAIAILVRGSWRERLEKWAPLVFIVGVGTLISVCVFRRTVDHDDRVIATIGFSFLAIMYGSLVVMCVGGVRWVGHLFSLSVLRMFGKYSYGLYLVHFPLTVVLGPLKIYFVSLTHSYLIGSSIHLAFNLAVNLSIAVASFQLFESPIMRLKHRFRYA